MFSIDVQNVVTECSTVERIKNFLNTNIGFTYGMDSQNLGLKINFVISESYAEALQSKHAACECFLTKFFTGRV